MTPQHVAWSIAKAGLVGTGWGIVILYVAFRHAVKNEYETWSGDDEDQHTIDQHCIG